MSTSPDGVAADAPLQFDAVEPVAPAASRISCGNCRRPIDDVYHQINAHVICEGCRTGLEQRFAKGEGTPGSRFGKAALFGLGGAVAGAVVYGVVMYGLHVEAGLAAVLVGYLAGKGVRKGSGNRGGPRYQALAMVLTYMAVACVYLPVAVTLMDKDGDKAAQTAPASSPAPAAPGAEATSASPAATAPAGAARKADGGDSHGPAFYVFAVAVLAAATPVIVVMKGEWFAGLMIGFALYQAWKMNVRTMLSFTGPFRVAPPVPAPAALVD